MLDAGRFVHAQNEDSSPPFRRQPRKRRIRINVKVLGPVLLTRVKELGCFARKRINRGDIGALGAIAGYACKAKIMVDIVSSVLERYNMVDFEADESIICGDSTVFAASASPLNDLAALLGGNCHYAKPFCLSLVLVFIREIIWSART